MLEIVGKNPNRLVQARVIVDKISPYNSETAAIIYRTSAPLADADLEYELVANWYNLCTPPKQVASSNNDSRGNDYGL